MTEATYGTPGVYVREVSAFPRSIEGVETAVPVFIGYTQKAVRRRQEIKDQPIRIASLAEYEAIFGGRYRRKFNVVDLDSPTPGVVAADGAPPFLLHQCIALFYANGGGPCWVVSVGLHEEATLEKHALLAGLAAAGDQVGPTMTLIPEATVLERFEAYAEVVKEMIGQAARLKDRVAIVDLRDGAPGDLQATVSAFRARIGPDGRSYGIAYHPWLHTSIVKSADLDLRDIAEPAPPDVLEIGSPVLDDIRKAIANHLNRLPPSAALAGVMSRIDATRGVFNAPANVSLNAVVAPVSKITDDEQQDLNTPTDGKAINTIREFVGRGTVVWGARTLDGNSRDYRYVQVRRTLIYIDQSIKLALGQFVFAANDGKTWATAVAMISSFLSELWSQGGLMGATPDEAYRVECGLGVTMTPEDILDGYLRVQVALQMTRPAEFIVLTFTQKLGEKAS